MSRLITLLPFIISSNFAWKISKFFLAIQGIGWGGDIKNSGELPLLKRHLKNLDKPVIFDIGAHVGEYLEACMNINNQARVHCFEPSKVHYKKLSSVNLEDESNVVINNFGLGLDEGSFTLYKDEEVSGLASFKKRDLNHLDISFDHQEVCEVRNPLRYCEENNIEYIDWLKVDIEGAEFQLFESFSPYFKEKKIKACQFEYGHANIESRVYFRDFYNFFSSHGYNLGILRPNGQITLIKNYEEKYENMYIANFVASID